MDVPLCELVASLFILLNIILQLKLVWFLFCSIHFCVTYLNTQAGVAELFLKDVKECCAKLLNDPQAKTEGMVCYEVKL